MKLDARKRDRQSREHKIRTMTAGGRCEVLTNAVACDTVEKWVEVFVPDLRKTGRKWMVSNGKIVTAKLRIDYDVVNVRTGMVVAEVRQGS